MGKMIELAKCLFMRKSEESTFLKRRVKRCVEMIELAKYLTFLT